MKINRLFEIVYILMNKTTTAKELAERFEVSVRTIYRDIETLSSSNIPIYTSQGRGGGIALLDGYILSKSILSEREQTEILFALQSLSATRYPEIEKVISKLSSLFNRDELCWIDVDFSLWGNDGYANEFNLLKTAIVNRQVLHFEYNNSLGEQSNRSVYPIKLLFKHNAWYLKAFCLLRQGQRTFKISRMSDMQITEETFADISIDELLEEAKKPMPATSIEVCMKISPGGAYRVFDEFDKNEIAKNSDGSFTVTSSYPEGEWLFNYILSFGSLAEVIKPEHIKKDVLRRLEESVKKYKAKI
jgi:predicted DNA-binding transcriptional regulator YafY